MIEYLDVFGLYQIKWTNADLVPAAFLHPAKMSKGLLRWIFQHAVERGYLVPRQTIVVDPFGGSATTVWGALQYECESVVVELEPFFVDIARGCDCTGVPDYSRVFGRAKQVAYRNRHLCPQCLDELGRIDEPAGRLRAKKKRDQRLVPLHQRFQDARGRLNAYKAAAVREYYERKGLGKPARLAMKREPMIVDPLPFPESYTPSNRQNELFAVARPDTLVYERNSGRIPRRAAHHYTGNVENWVRVFGGKATVLQGDSRFLGQVVAEAGLVVGSPPYATEALGHHRGKAGDDREATGQYKQGYTQGQMGQPVYGKTSGQLAALSLGSPSWAGNSGGQTEAARNGIDAGIFDRHQGGRRGGVGQSEGNIGAMSMGSPPFIDTEPTQDDNFRYNGKKLGTTGKHYGTSPNQLGNLPAQTFWQASEMILRELYQILPLGAASIWVCKAFIKDGKRVDFGRQWADLCAHCGFELVEWIRAWQVYKLAEVVKMFGESVVITKGGVSFFRNLQNQRYKEAGEAEKVIENEDVLILIRR